LAGGKRSLADNSNGWQCAIAAAQCRITPAPAGCVQFDLDATRSTTICIHWMMAILFFLSTVIIGFDVFPALKL
jgi:hypothetical protein